MSFAGMNYLAILLAAIASFLFGGAWYGALSQQWMAAVGKSKAEIDKSGMAVPMVLTFIALLVMAWVLAGVIGHLGRGQVTVRNGIISGAFVWLGFVATTLMVNHAYQGAKRTLTLIDGAHWLGVLVIQGLVIGWMGVR
jgi:uncharacterized membrane protein required for colicin V production